MNAAQRWPVGLWLAGLLACALVVVRSDFSADLSSFLPRSPSVAQQILVEQLHSGMVSRLILVGIEGAPPRELAALSEDLLKRLRQEPSFISVENGSDFGLEKDRDFLWRNRYLLSPSVTPETFTAEGLQRALDEDLQLLGSALAGFVKSMIPADPTLEMLHLIRQFEGEARPAMRDGVWFSRDGSRALLLVQTRAPGFDADAQQLGLERMQAEFASAKAAIKTSGDARLLATGPAVFSVSTRDKVKEDVSRLSILATLGVAGLLLLVYRSPRLLVLALLPVATGALAGIAAVGLGFGSVHGITLGFGVTLIGEAVDYAIYLFTQTAPGSPPEQTLPRIWPTLLLGVLTSICGFSAMLLSSFRGLAQLGLFSIVGLIVAVAVTRWVLPVLMPRNFAPRGAAVFAPAIMQLVGRARSLRYPLLLVVAAATVLLIFDRGSIWDDELASLSPVPQQEQRLDAALRRDIGAPDVRYLLIVPAPSEERALSASEELGTWLDKLVAERALLGFDSPARYLPSREAQRRRQSALPSSDTLGANLSRALTDLPFQPDLFKPFLRDADAARTAPLLDRDSLQGTNLLAKLDSLLINRNEGWAAILPLRGVADQARMATELAPFRQLGVILLDLKGDSDRLYQGYRRQALILSLIGAAVILVLLALALRSLRRVYDVLGPLAAAVVVTTALLVGSGQRLSIFNLVGLLLVVAVGSNYALFFERQNAATTGVDRHRERVIVSVVLANLCTVIGFGVLSISRIPVLHGIGVTVAVGAVLSLVFSAILSIHRRAETVI